MGTAAVVAQWIDGYREVMNDNVIPLRLPCPHPPAEPAVIRIDAKLNWGLYCGDSPRKDSP